LYRIVKNLTWRFFLDFHTHRRYINVITYLVKLKSCQQIIFYTYLLKLKSCQQIIFYTKLKQKE
jgi:hypothetical protein